MATNGGSSTLLRMRRLLAPAALAVLACAAAAQEVAVPTAKDEASKEQPTLTQRRSAVHGDVTHLLYVVPEPAELKIPDADRDRLGPEGLAQLKALYAIRRKEAEDMRAATTKPMTAEKLQPLEQRLPALQAELLSLLFSATSSHYFDDKDRFVQDKAREMSIRVADTKIKGLDKRLGAVPDAQTLDSLYDRAHARPVSSQVTLIYGGARGPSSQALAGVKVSEFKPQIPDAANYLDVPAAVLTGGSADPAPVPASAPSSGLMSLLDVSKATALARDVMHHVVGFGGHCLAGVADALFRQGLMSESFYHQIMPARRSGRGYTHWAADMAPALDRYFAAHPDGSPQVRMHPASWAALGPWVEKDTLPLGTMIVYSPGACGAHPKIGHIEIVSSQQPLLAVSDGRRPVPIACVKQLGPTGKVRFFVPAKPILEGR
jgi:hypothetical protein